jgi:hypothetical protein
MAIKVYGVKTISERLLKVRESLRSQELLERIGRLAVREIRERTAQGLDKDLKPLKALKDKTIKKRIEMAAYNKTSSRYIDIFSNLHFTGDLLRSLKPAFAKGRVELFFSGTHKRYKTKDGKVGMGGVENADIARWQKDQGRDILGVDQTLRQKIREMVARHLRAVLRR